MNAEVESFGRYRLWPISAYHPRNFPEESEKTTKSLSQDGRGPGLDPNPALPEYETRN
jgi:hypothetical protein